ncbi:MAG: prephenate dehydrogenase/arogenate dehydrogenase family protein [Alphaproteobacteria bacterium]|nr:prephenate dehydrogenase/arogenate dehydrogenase family protein [Alphaproteobacteria bacterium]
MTEVLGIIGFGAFGEFIVPHLAAHRSVRVYDSKRDLGALAKIKNVEVCDLATLCQSDIIIIATPVKTFEDVVKTIVPHLRAGQLVMDVGSVKVLPAKLLQDHLPAYVDIIGLHPLFGPQSGKNGIQGLNVTVCNVRGSRDKKIVPFLKDKLGLNVIEATPEQHDKEMAYVQGLTHLIGKVFVGMDLPEFAQTTKTYTLLKQMVEMVRYDSDDLFRSIERDNPFSVKAKTEFFTVVSELEKKLNAKP